MVAVEREPLIKVALMKSPRVRLTLSGAFATATGDSIPEGDYLASTGGDGLVRLEGKKPLESPEVNLVPVNFSSSRFTLHGVTIGVDFHWERKEPQSFQGELRLRTCPEGVAVLNEVPLEAYLFSVVSSEMSGSAPAEFLRAHAIISRGWLLAQLYPPADKHRGSTPSDPVAVARGTDGLCPPADKRAASTRGPIAEPGEIVRWYDRESHTDFDVCADDHCQRYQGITSAFSTAASQAVRDTGGKVLVYEDEICDARYSKCCGGMTEAYRTAWEDKDVPYLVPVYDGPNELVGYPTPLTSHRNAARFINSLPPAFCNTGSAELLARILPGFDQETRDFYRWEVVYNADELSEILQARLGMDFGRVQSLEPLERGPSGRISRLRIKGEKRSLVLGKELEIRRALSRSHLYSSAFVVRTEKDAKTGQPIRFHLAGAGWGHGVGLCQIGAAVMAEYGHTYEETLSHYFRGASLRTLY